MVVGSSFRDAECAAPRLVAAASPMRCVACLMNASLKFRHPSRGKSVHCASPVVLSARAVTRIVESSGDIPSTYADGLGE